MALFATLASSRPSRIFILTVGLGIILLYISSSILSYGIDPQILRWIQAGKQRRADGFGQVQEIAQEHADLGFDNFGDGKAAPHGTAKGKLDMYFTKAVTGSSQATSAPMRADRPEKPKTYSPTAEMRPPLYDLATEEEWYRMSGQMSITSTPTSATVNSAQVVAASHATGAELSVSARETQALMPVSKSVPSSAEQQGVLASPVVGIVPVLQVSSPTPTTSLNSLPRATPLVLYAFAAADWALPNLRFFLTHSLHANANFVFILNGALPDPKASADEQIVFSPDLRIDQARELITSYTSLLSNDNVHVVDRPNTCYDLGAFGQVLTANSSDLYTTHNRFILINASLRGPFVPLWSHDCWTDAYLRPLNTLDWMGRQIKLVGMTINCVEGRPRHVQSMILATDDIGMKILLGLETTTNLDRGTTSASNVTSQHSSQTESQFRPLGLGACPSTYIEAVDLEVSLTPLILSHNYSATAMFALAHSWPDYIETCTNGDVNAGSGWYEGFDLTVWETMFIKTRWGVESKMVERITEWMDSAVVWVEVGDVESESRNGSLSSDNAGDERVPRIGKGRSWELCAGSS